MINREIYPYFFTTETTDITLNPIRLAMLQRFNWTRVATIHHIEELQEIVSLNITSMNRFRGHKITYLRKKLLIKSSQID